MEQVLQMENGRFTLLVFSVNRGMGRETGKFYGCIAENLAEKKNEGYSMTIAWLRREISLSLMRSTTFVRGSRSMKFQSGKENLKKKQVTVKAALNFNELQIFKGFTI